MSDWGKDKKESINCFLGVDTENNLTNDLSIDVQFAVYLCNSNRLGKFETWFNNISKCNSALLFDLMKNEDFCLCIVRLKIFQKKYDQAFKLLESGPFSAKEEYVKLWEDAHYKQKEAALGQPLTPLQRFRLRKKFPPPVNICPSGRQIINPLFKEASVILKRWYQEHSTYPYPSVKEKQMLAQKTGLTLYQIKTWFANTRRRKKIHQMQSSLKHHKLLNKKLFLLDSEQLLKESSKALDLSIQNLEIKADQECASSDRAGGMYTDAECLLKQANKKTHADLKEESSEEHRNENSQNVSRTSHKWCFYCSDFGEASLHEIDQSDQQSISSSETGTFLNTNLGKEFSEKQNSANVPNSLKGRKNSDLINMFMPQHKSLEANLNKNTNNFNPHSSSEELTKPISPQKSDSRFQILNKTTYSPLHLPSVSVSQQQQVTTNCCDTVSIPSPTPHQFLTNITQTPTDFICPNPTIYPIPIVTTSIDPSVNLGVFRQDRSYHPSSQSSVNSSMMLNQEIQNTFQNNFDSYATTTESIPYSTNPNLNSSFMSEYPVSNTLHPATETLAFGVACPLLPSTTSINHHLQIIPSSNLQTVQINKDWNQLTRSCGQSPAAGHDIMTLGTSISQMPQNLDGVTRKKELMNVENEIAHTLLILARNGNKAHMSNQGQ